MIQTSAAAQELQHHHHGRLQDEGPSSPKAPVSEALQNACLQAKDLEVAQRMNDGKLEDLPLDAVRDLWDTLGTEPNGGLAVDKVRYMLRHVIEPRPQTEKQAFNRVLNKLMDTNGTRTMSAEEFHMLLSIGPPMVFISQLQEVAGDHTRDHHHQLDVIPDRTDEATRDDLCDYVSSTVDKHDAFMTLPVTLVYIFIFIFLVWQHLKIENRRELAESMRQWINGREEFTALDNNCEDMNAYWEWLIGVGLGGLYGNAQVNEHTNFTQYVAASRNIILGDVNLAYEMSTGNSAAQWLLQTDVATAHLSSSPTDHLGAAKLAATDLRAQGWDADDINYMVMSFLSYSETSQIYGITEVRTSFEDTGNVRCVIDTVTVPVNLYPHWPVTIIDVFFVMIIAFMAFQELRDMCGSLRLGCGEFLDYWKFWNVVDWISISLGIFTITLWGYMCIFIGDGVQGDILNEDYRLQEDVMTMDVSRLEKVEEQIDKFGWVLFFMHIVTAVNTLTIVLKFFKAFQSNPRLQVVTDTLRNAAGDLCHFMIIFLTIFLPFAIVGHLLFGQDMADFASFSASANTGIISLMGEFTWYVEGVGPLQLTQRLPSGMPCIVVFLWYFVYMFMVLLVLLNMLLAIILKHYTTVTDLLGDDAPSIWAQVGAFWRFQQETRGFLSLEKLRRNLDNDAEPAHEEDYVTSDSLIQAFPGMSVAQADWVCDKIAKAIEVQQRMMEQDAGSRRLEHLEHLMEGTSEELRLVSKSVQDTREKLYADASEEPVRGRVRGVTVDSDDARLDALERDVANVLQKLMARAASKEAPVPGVSEGTSSADPTLLSAKSKKLDQIGEAPPAPAKRGIRQRVGETKGIAAAQTMGDLTVPAEKMNSKAASAPPTSSSEIIGASENGPGRSPAPKPRRRPPPLGRDDATGGAQDGGPLIPSDLPRSYGKTDS